MAEILHLFSDYTFQVVALGAALLGMLGGAVGSIAVLRKQSLIGDGLSHAALPGVVLGFLLTGQKETEVLLLGGLLTGLLATWAITAITKRTRLKFDSALALVLAVFFGLGMVLLTCAQRLPNANQAGLDRFIYGQAASLVTRDLTLMCLCGAVLLGGLALFWKEVKLYAFDPGYAKALGLPVELLDGFLALATVVTILVGLQTVGAILMSSMLVAPAVAARQWSDRLSTMVVLAGIFGGVSGVVGTLCSSWMPNLPTGPSIVVCACFFALFGILFAPQRGVIARWLARRRTQLSIRPRRETL